MIIIREVASIVAALRTLATALEQLAGGAEPEAVPTEAPLVSTRRQTQLRAQGYYVGALQKLTARDKARVKKVYQKEGVVAATRLAKSLAK